MNNFTFYAKWYKENFKYEDVPEALVGYLPVFKRERVKTVCVGHVDEILRETLSYYTNAPEALFRKDSRKVCKRDLIARKALRNGFDNLSVTEWYYIEGILRSVLKFRRAFFYAELGGRSLPYVDFVCLSVIINAIRRMWKEWAEFYLES